MVNVVALNNIFDPNQTKLHHNSKNQSLHDLANEVMGEGVVCLAGVNGVGVIADWQQEITETDFVVLYPVVLGGDDSGSKDFFRIIAQVALIAAAGWAAPIAGAALSTALGGAISATVATQIAQASLMFVGSLAINALLPPSQQSPKEVFKNLNPQNNVARLGQALPQVFGEYLVYPDLVVQPRVWYVGNKPRMSETFYFGNGVGEVNDLKLGDSPIADFAELSIDIVQNDEIPTRYAVPNAQGIELLMPRDDGKPHLDTWPTGQGFTPWFNVCPPYEVLDSEGTLGFKFELSLSFPRGVKEFSVKSSTVGVVDEYDYYGGLMLEWQVIDDFGVAAGASGNFEIKVPVKPSDLGTSEAYNATIIFVNEYSPTIPIPNVSHNASLLAGLQAAPAELYNKRVKVRLRREVVKSDDSSDATSVSIVSINGYGKQGNTLNGLIGKFEAGQMKRLPANGGQIINGIVKRHINTFIRDDAGNFVSDGLRFENTCAQVMFHLLLELYGSFKLVKDYVDLNTLYDLHLHNIAHNERFNTQIKQQIRYWDLLQQVGFGMRVKPMNRGDKLSFIRDEAPQAANRIFNPYHTVKGSASIDFDFDTSAAVHDGVRLEFINASVWQHGQVEVAIKGSERPKNPLVIDAVGMTDFNEVKKLAEFMARAMRYRKTNITWNTEWDGLLVQVGDVVNFINGIVYKGETAQINGVSGLTLFLDKPIEGSFDHAVLRLEYAKPSQHIAITISADKRSITLSEPPIVDGVTQEILSFVDVDYPDTVSLFTGVDAKPCLVRVTGKKMLKNGVALSGYEENLKVYEGA